MHKMTRFNSLSLAIFAFLGLSSVPLQADGPTDKLADGKSADKPADSKPSDKPADNKSAESKPSDKPADKPPAPPGGGSVVPPIVSLPVGNPSIVQNAEKTARDAVHTAQEKKDAAKKAVKAKQQAAEEAIAAERKAEAVAAQHNGT